MSSQPAEKDVPRYEGGATYQAVRNIQAQGIRDAMCALRDESGADVEVALGGVDWVLAWLRERADGLSIPSAEGGA